MWIFKKKYEDNLAVLKLSLELATLVLVDTCSNQKLLCNLKCLFVGGGVIKKLQILI